MNRVLIFSLILIGVGVFHGCRPDPVPSPDPVEVPSEGVFILNEGNFQWGNASLDLYDPATDSLRSGVFSAANEDEPLGDVLQSMTIWDGRAFLVVNNSEKIEVMNPNTLERLWTITGFNSPRYMIPLNSSKAYVTDLYEGGIYVVNLGQLAIESFIETGEWTEQGALYNSRAYFPLVGVQEVRVINPAFDMVVSTIPLEGKATGEIVLDAQNNLWMGTSTQPGDSTSGMLLKMDPDEESIIQTFLLPEGVKPSRLQMNPTGDTLYFVAGDVWALPIEATALPTQPFLTQPEWLVYGLGVDPRNGDIYVADAIDYVQRGVVFRYNAKGELLSEILVGLIPGGFGFR